MFACILLRIKVANIQQRPRLVLCDVEQSRSRVLYEEHQPPPVVVTKGFERNGYFSYLEAIILFSDFR